MFIVLENKIFLQLCRALVEGTDIEKITWKNERIAGSEPGRLYQIITDQSMQSLLVCGFESYINAMSQIHPERAEEFAKLADRVRSAARSQIIANYRIWHETDRIVGRLEDAGIRVVLLKGAAAGILYPEPECRKSGDIDLWIPDADPKGSAKLHTFGKAFDRASEILSDSGYSEEKDEISNYHMGFLSETGPKIELHGRITRELDDRGAMQCIDAFMKSSSERISRVEVHEGLMVPSLTGADLGFYLLLHMIHHFVGGGFGFRLLLDIVMYLKQDPDDEEKKRFYSYVESSGLLTFTASMCTIGVKKLGLPYDSVSFMFREKSMEAYDTTELLINELFEAKEFGNDPDRMAAPKNSSVFGLISEFHHQMTRNYPVACKYIPLWPALWTMTLARYLHNNRVLHRAPATAMIKKSRDRAKLREKLRLYEE